MTPQQQKARRMRWERKQRKRPAEPKSDAVMRQRVGTGQVEQILTEKQKWAKPFEALEREVAK
jgi:hypothetical protein